MKSELPGSLPAVDLARHAATYDVQAPLFEELRGEVEFAIEAAFRDHPVKLHSIRSRVKARESFLVKVSKKSYQEPFDQMSDIVGARIVCLFLDDLPLIDEILKSIFDVFDEDNKSSAVQPELFRYQSIHYQARIRDDHVGPHYDGIKHLDFEIQVRTILQDAWASVEHTLAYKGPRSIPNELKRDISALVGLFHVADKSFQHLRDQITQSENIAKELIEGAAETVSSGEANSEVDVPVNRGTLKALLRQLYPYRESSHDFEYSDFADELGAVGLSTIGGLRTLLNENSSAAEEHERTLIDAPPMPLSDTGYYFTDIGVARTIVASVIEDYTPPVSDDDDDEDDEDDEALMH